MKEIIYIQAGSSANHIGSHFWNIQENYFPFEDDANAEVAGEVDYGVSYREGRTKKVSIHDLFPE